MIIHASKLKSTALAALAATVIAGGATTFTATEAEAQWRPGVRVGGGWAPRAAFGGGHWGHRPYRAWRPARGAAVAAGIVGGLAAGALIAGATAPAYAAPVYGPPSNYYGAPAYYEPSYAYSYQPTCYTRRCASTWTTIRW